MDKKQKKIVKKILTAHQATALRRAQRNARECLRRAKAATNENKKRILRAAARTWTLEAERIRKWG